MKVKVIRPFTDKNSLKSIPKDAELEITEKRFSELTAGPLGIFVEKLPELPEDNNPENLENEKPAVSDKEAPDKTDNEKPDDTGKETPDKPDNEKENKTAESAENVKSPKKKRATRKTTKK